MKSQTFLSGSVGSLLENKGGQVWSIQPEAVVFEAIQLMCEKNIGALPVLESDAVIGIISERDYTRKVILQGKSSKDTLVREIMTSPIQTATPEQTIWECLHLMTDKRIRHLPVLIDGKLSGIISIGDLVKWVISAQNATIQNLEDYISGRYPG